MPDGPPPRRPVQARPVQARPVTPPAGAAPPLRPVQARPVRAKPVPGAKPPAPPAAETVVTRKTVVTPKIPAKPKVIVVADEVERDDRPPESGSKKKKKRFSDEERRRIREEKGAEAAEERMQALQEWVFPGILAGVGILLTIFSAFYHSSSANHAVGAGLMIVASAVYASVMVPVAIILLMIVGKLCGIEYGSIGHAFRSLGGIMVLLVGVYWTGALFGMIGFFVTPPIASIVTYVLFLKMFELDADESRTTSGVMNFITWVGGVVFRVIVVSQLLIGHARHQPDYDPDFGDDPPGMVVNGNDDFGPDPDEPPPPKAKAKGGKPRPPAGNDWNDDF